MWDKCENRWGQGQSVSKFLKVSIDYKKTLKKDLYCSHCCMKSSKSVKLKHCQTILKILESKVYFDSGAAWTANIPRIHRLSRGVRLILDYIYIFFVHVLEVYGGPMETVPYRCKFCFLCFCYWKCLYRDEYFD